MAIVRPFRAVRPDPARVDPGTIVADASSSHDVVTAAVARDPRHLGQLLCNEAPREGAFVVLDLLRAGVLVRDRLPSLTVVRTAAEQASRTCCFAAVRADSLAVVVSASAVATNAVVARPVMLAFVDKKGRVQRAMDAETEREPDAAFVVDGTDVEVWIVDDDSAAARLASLLEGAASAIVGADEVVAESEWLLGCFVDEEHIDAQHLGFVPAGVCLLPTINAV